LHIIYGEIGFFNEIEGQVTPIFDISFIAVVFHHQLSPSAIRIRSLDDNVEVVPHQKKLDYYYFRIITSIMLKCGFFFGFCFFELAI